jgi:hypothetical protein
LLYIHFPEQSVPANKYNDDMITFISYDNPFFDRLSDEARNEMKKFGR